MNKTKVNKSKDSSPTDKKTKKKKGVKSVDSMLAFFIMPGEALALLHDELEAVVGKKMSQEILYKYGYNCGKSITERLNLEKKSMKDVPIILTEIWSELGFGRITVISKDDDKIEVQITEGIEANALGYRTAPSCHFTRGYMAGVVSAIVNTRLYAVEEECVTSGSNFCRIKVARRLII